MDRFNLFRFATSEHAHSAFWAWVFQAAAARDDALEGPKGIGESAIRHLDEPIPNGAVEVDTEPALSSRDRPDLRVDFDDGHSLFVELKKDEPFREAQIRRYQEASGEDDVVGLISTHYDADDAEDVCPYLDLDDLRQLLWTYREDHPLLSDYAAWVDRQKEKREELRRKAFSDDPHAVAAALSTLYGQKQVMDAVTDPMEGWTKQAHGSRGGAPYTEFRIAEASADQDTLFYRIDEYSPGYYISLKQYLGGEDEPAWDGKEERLARLRRWWNDALRDTDHRLEPRAPHNAGTKTREVGCFLFKKNPPSLVAEDLPRIHDSFTTTLEQHGWELGVDR